MSWQFYDTPVNIQKNNTILGDRLFYYYILHKDDNNTLTNKYGLFIEKCIHN